MMTNNTNEILTEIMKDPKKADELWQAMHRLRCWGASKGDVLIDNEWFKVKLSKPIEIKRRPI